MCRGPIWILETAQSVLAQAALPLGPYDPADPMVLEPSVADGDAVWSLGRPLLVNHRRGLWGFEPYRKQDI